MGWADALGTRRRARPEGGAPGFPGSEMGAAVDALIGCSTSGGEPPEDPEQMVDECPFCLVPEMSEPESLIVHRGELATS